MGRIFLVFKIFKQLYNFLLYKNNFQKFTCLASVCSMKKSRNYSKFQPAFVTVVVGALLFVSSSPDKDDSLL